jgi:hypothetical protein
MKGIINNMLSIIDRFFINKEETIKRNRTLEERLKEFGISVYDSNGVPRPLYDIIMDARQIYWSLNDDDKDELGRCFMGHYYHRIEFENIYMRKDNE